MKEMLDKIISSDDLHAKWLNTLSYLENCGARKIAACEHATLVKEEMLKHAAEEFRHAHYLKSQIERLSVGTLQDYSLGTMLGGLSTLRYLDGLDLQTCKYLSREAGMSRHAVREAAYTLVTYAIELRAGVLYPLYEEMLRKHRSKVMVKSIVLEEQEHLDEMRHQLSEMEYGMAHAQRVCRLEEELSIGWLEAVSREVCMQ